MAEFKFSVLSINSSLKEQSVFIECALDIDEDSVNADNIILMNKETKAIALFDAIVDGRIIQLKLRNWAAPNQKYTLIVQAGIKSVVGDTLESSLFRNFTFASEITTTASFLSPVNFETITDMNFSWAESGEKPIGDFYIEIASDNAFYNIVQKLAAPGIKNVTLADIPEGQYYARIRVQRGEQYGVWSDTITFVKKGSLAPVQPPTPTDPESPGDETVLPVEIEDDTVIVKDTTIDTKAVPENGVTPLTFTFAFDEDISPEGIEISIIRSDV